MSIILKIILSKKQTERIAVNFEMKAFPRGRPNPADNHASLNGCLTQSFYAELTHNKTVPRQLDSKPLWLNQHLDLCIKLNRQQGRSFNIIMIIIIIYQLAT